MPTMTPARSTVAPAPGPACADDPELMFPLVESERPWRPTHGEAAAQAVCARCPVLARCRRDVLAGGPMPYGVAGGLTVADRRAIRVSRRRPERAPAPADGTAQDGEQRDGMQRDGERASVPKPAPRPVIPGPDLETAIAEVMAAHARHEHHADAVTVRALALEHDRASASRWEVALAAVALLTTGAKVSPTARALRENYAQIVRWRDRHAADQALVRAGAGAGQLARPSATDTDAPRAAAAQSRGAA